MNTETEEKRLKDFRMIAENWDSIPEYARGKLDGTISTLMAMFGDKPEDSPEKAG